MGEGQTTSCSHHLALCPPKVPVLSLAYLASFYLSPTPSHFPTLLAQTLSHPWPSPPVLTYCRGCRSTTGPAGLAAHARVRPRGSMTTPWSPGLKLFPQRPAHFSPRLRDAFTSRVMRLGGPGTMETARSSPRGALGGAPYPRLLQKARPAAWLGGADIPKRLAFSPRKEDVSMVFQAPAAILHRGPLETSSWGTVLRRGLAKTGVGWLLAHKAGGDFPVGADVGRPGETALSVCTLGHC